MTRVLIATFACGLALFTTLTVAPTKSVEAAEIKVPKDTCVKPCAECAKHCAEGVKYTRENKMENLAAPLEVCHNMCLACQQAVATKNISSWAICEVCEKVCNETAEQLEKSTDDKIKHCAKVCRDCAKACADARK